MDLKSALVISDYVVRSSGKEALTEFSNKVHAGGELFLRIDLEHCEEVSLDV